MLKQRVEFYAWAHQDNPQCESKNARSWTYVEAVHLNPDKPETKEPLPIQKAAWLTTFRRQLA
jgi:hypothetical protein